MRLLIVGEYDSSIDSLPKICEGEEIEVFLNDFEGDPFGSWSGGTVEEIPAESGDYYFKAEGKEAGEYEITYEILGDCGTSTSTNIVISELPDARFFGADSVYCDNITDSVQLIVNTEAVSGEEASRSFTMDTLYQAEWVMASMTSAMSFTTQ